MIDTTNDEDNDENHTQQATNICASFSVTAPALQIYTDQPRCLEMGRFSRQSTCVCVHMGSCMMLPGLPLSCLLTSSPFAALQIDMSQPNVGSGADARPGGGPCGPEPEQLLVPVVVSTKPQAKLQTPHIRQGWLDTWHWMKPSRRWMEELGRVGKRRTEHNLA